MIEQSFSQMYLWVDTIIFTGIVTLPRKYQPMCQNFVQFMLSQKKSTFSRKINHRQMARSVKLQEIPVVRDPIHLATLLVQDISQVWRFSPVIN